MFICEREKIMKTNEKKETIIKNHKKEEIFDRENFIFLNLK